MRSQVLVRRDGFRTTIEDGSAEDHRFTKQDGGKPCLSAADQRAALRAAAANEVEFCQTVVRIAGRHSAPRRALDVAAVA